MRGVVMKNEYEQRGDIIVIFLPRKVGEPIEAHISYGDFDVVDAFPNTWTAALSKSTGKFYVNGYYKKKIIGLHRWLMDAEPGTVVDHIDGNPLNNRLSNLRVVTHSANSLNAPKRRNNSTGVVGVYLHKPSGKYHARVRSKGIRHDLGKYDLLEDAAIAVKNFKENEIMKDTRPW